MWQANGELVDKMDPYAFYSELRPNTASIVSDLSYDGWTDKEWLNQRNKGFDSPVNIYEMHVGSWRKDDENEEFVQYHEIEKELVEHCKKHTLHMLKSCRYVNTRLMVLGVINVRVIFQVLLVMEQIMN